MTGIDFGRLGSTSASDTATEPRRIFSALPAKSAKFGGYPRDVQSEVWERWHELRDASDLLIKMNTGGGKTLVGLLILKSCLNEGVGPAVYLAPDVYLANQVQAEARELGLETVDDPHSPRFQEGKAILVINVYKLINGMSVFGVTGDAKPAIPIGALLVDDAHACLATVEQQFTLGIPATHPAYTSLLQLFSDDLQHQSAASFRDLTEGVGSTAALQVPFWTWFDKRDKVIAALHPYRGDDAFKFVWPLIAESLPMCRAAFSTEELEIAPPCPPIHRITSWTRARRRIYLTATLADDSVLVTHFAADPVGISEPITPKSAGDLGDRMILTPLETHPGTSDEELRAFLAAQAERHNVVVIVPSRRRAEEWRPFAAAVHDTKTIHDGVAALHNGHVGLAVLINRYDGIDLPGDACRILVLDGLPEYYGALDRIDALSLDESDAMVTRQVQRIEQGMGRGTRSAEDFCVVLLLGSRLTQRIYSASALRKFSLATQAQISLSRQVADLLHGRPFAELEAVIDRCLDRDTGWIAASKNALDGLKYVQAAQISPVAVAMRGAFDDADLGRFQSATDKMRHVINAIEDSQLRGWLKQLAAGYLHPSDPVAAQALQGSAQGDNRALLKPISGVEYRRLSSTTNQAQRAAAHLAALYSSGTEVLLGFRSVLDDLVPDSDSGSAGKFEQAMHDLGEHLGFVAQRPERDTGQGPDVLWLLGDLAFLVIECKSGATTDFIARHDAEQLSHSMDWFKEHYDDTCNATPVMVHRTALLHSVASARTGMRVINEPRLIELKDAVRRFAESIAGSDAFRDGTKVAERLNAFELNGKVFSTRWGVPTAKAK